ncbi:hypothetical protein [Actinocorallia aurantiaca]|uniref:Uncharacterized protein n=1 Tax=Actinocorallia aurantiaca TaxID=46204 RepID=A0ABP6H4H5_9ACTN
MTLVRFVQDDEYWRENVGLTVQDVLDDAFWLGLGARLSGDDFPMRRWILPEGVEEPESPPSPPWSERGTFACGGRGRLSGVPYKGKVGVRIEFHEAPAAAEDFRKWDAVSETLYFSRSGRITAGSSRSTGELELGGQSLYRVRVLAERRADGTRWCLRFWKVDGDAELPRWFKRSGPPVGPECSGWEDLLAEPLWLLYQAAVAASEDQPAAWGTGAVSPGEILRFLRPYGDCEDDEVFCDGGALVEALEILVHEGLLIREAYGYRAVPDPGVPSERAARCVHDGLRFHELAVDLCSIMRWTTREQTLRVEELAERLLVSADEVRSALASCPLLRLSPDDRVSALHTWGQDAREWSFQPMFRDSYVFMEDDERPWRPSGPSTVPFGAPPAAGVIAADGRLTIWRDGESVVLIDWDEDPDFMMCCYGPEGAWETPHGIVLVQRGLELVAWNGERLPIGEGSYETPQAFSADGRHLAAVRKARRGRGQAEELHLIDLVDGSHEVIQTIEGLVPPRPDLSPAGTRTFTVEENGSSALIRDQLSGSSRLLRLPEPVSGESAVWEDDEHLLLDGREHLRVGQAARVYRLNVVSGAVERASFCGPGHNMRKLVRPWHGR